MHGMENSHILGIGKGLGSKSVPTYFYKIESFVEIVNETVTLKLRFSGIGFGKRTESSPMSKQMANCEHSVKGKSHQFN
jgi:hypothetical protein